MKIRRLVTGPIINDGLVTRGVGYIRSEDTMSATPLTQQDLKDLTCAEPGCTHDSHENGLALHSRCHPSQPTWAWYKDGVLTVRCSRCESVVATIAVAQ